MNITIGIPTFNRPESLARVLQHLSSFKSVPEEVVVGDNSGTGSAAGVIDSYKDKFKSLIYLRRPANVGVSRNVDSIARVGTNPYIYLLADDDFVYEGALLFMKSILDTQAEVSAINGGYDGTRLGVVGLDKVFTDVVGSVIPKGGYTLLWNHLEITDNHPLMRRVDFVRHARYREISCSVAPVIFDLLQYGSFIHLNSSVLQHEQRSDSISSRIASHEVTDMSNGDLEIVSCKANLLADNGNTVRGRVMRNVYFQGARLLFSSGQFLTGWHSLMRSHAYQGLGERTKIWVEKNIVPKVICEKIVQIAADTGCSRIVSKESVVSNVWMIALNNQLKGHPNQVLTNGIIPRQLVLTVSGDVLPETSAEVIISISSLVAQFSLSGCKIFADTSGDMLCILSNDQSWFELDSTGEMQILALQTPYA